MIISDSLIQGLTAFIFIAIVGLHLSRKNIHDSILYRLQSLAVVVILFASFLERGSLALLAIAILTFIIKVILAPSFFIRLIKQSQLTFSDSSNLTTPLALLVIMGITGLANSHIAEPLTSIIPAHQTILALALASMFVALFLMINHRGALAQILGILSLENSIVIFAIFAGLEESPALQLGIIFDIFAWIIIALIFVRRIYEHYGSIDVTSMRKLKH